MWECKRVCPGFIRHGLRAAADPAVSESAWPHPQVPYAVSKLAAEHYIFALGELNEIETVALRIFNAYGPGQRMPPVHAPVVPHFVKGILSGASVVVHGDGKQTRDFVYIDDVVDCVGGSGDCAGRGSERSSTSVLAKRPASTR